MTKKLCTLCGEKEVECEIKHAGGWNENVCSTCYSEYLEKEAILQRLRNTDLIDHIYHLEKDLEQLRNSLEYKMNDKRLSWVVENDGKVFIVIAWNKDGQVFNSILPAEEVTDILIQHIKGETKNVWNI